MKYLLVYDDHAFKTEYDTLESAEKAAKARLRNFPDAMATIYERKYTITASVETLTREVNDD